MAEIAVISKGLDADSGLEIKRQFVNFIPEWNKKSIYVTYKEWLETSTGTKVKEVFKGYYCNDIPAVYYGIGEIKTPEVLFEVGEMITPPITEDDVEITPAVIATGVEVKVPAVLYDGTEIKTEANLKFTKWMEYSIEPEMAGKKLGFDIIIGAINYTLTVLPPNVPDGYVIGT